MYRDFRLDPAPVAEGAAIAGALLIAEHIGLWHWRGSLPLPVRYGLGTLALLIGFTHVCHRRGDLRPAVEFGALAAGGGAVVAAAHLLRYWRYQQRERRLDVLYRKSDALRA